MKNWFELSFQEKLLKVHEINLFPERRDKNSIEFLNMIIEKLIDETDNMTDEEINNFFS